MVHVIVAKPLPAWTIDELLSACPEAGKVLARHGVDPRTRCHRAARGYMTLKQVLGRTCLVDDVKTTFADLEALRKERS